MSPCETSDILPPALTLLWLGSCCCNLLCLYSWNKPLKSPFYVSCFYECSINPKVSIRSMTKKREAKLGGINKKNQCLLVEDITFEKPNLKKRKYWGLYLLFSTWKSKGVWMKVIRGEPWTPYGYCKLHVWKERVRKGLNSSTLDIHKCVLMMIKKKMFYVH